MSINLGGLLYFIDKYGLVEGVKVYAPEDVKADSIVVTALAQIEIAEVALRARVEKLMESRDD